MTRAAPLAAVLFGCAGPIEVCGGPRDARHRIEPDRLAEALRPLVATSPAALAKLEEAEDRAALAATLFAIGLGALLPCAALPVADGFEGGALTWAGVGACGASIGLDVAAIAAGPSRSDWGDVLRAHARERPTERWWSEDLGVERH